MNENEDIAMINEMWKFVKEFVTVIRTAYKATRKMPEQFIVQRLTETEHPKDIERAVIESEGVFNPRCFGILGHQKKLSQNCTHCCIDRP